MSRELREFLTSKGVVMSRTTSYNPAGNGQVEKYNGTIWKVVTTYLKSKALPAEYWQEVLPDVLHSVRSLLCTATNETPHERFLGFPSRSLTGSSIPTWLTVPGPVYVKRNVRNSKMDPLQVDLLQANPHYAHVRYPDGRETTVSTKSLAPRGQPTTEVLPVKPQAEVQSATPPPAQVPPAIQQPPAEAPLPDQGVNRGTAYESEQAPIVLRRSWRKRRPVDRLNL